MIRLLAIFYFLVLSSGLSAQLTSEPVKEELRTITAQYQLSDTQISQVSKLIIKRNQDINSLEANLNLDEPLRNLKRSSIIKGFEGSLNLMLNDDQRSLAQQQKSKERRKKRIATIEELKKQGYSQAEILKHLDHK